MTLTLYYHSAQIETAEVPCPFIRAAVAGILFAFISKGTSNLAA